MPTSNTSDALQAASSGSAATPQISRDDYKQWVVDQLQRLRNFRRPYDQRRAYFYRQYIGQRDRKMYPDNLTARSNTFFPYPSSNVETVVSRVHDAFFSVDPPIEARAKGGSDSSAQAMQCVLLSSLARANWITAIELMTRDLAIYGHAALKVDWDWDYDVVSGPEPIFAQQPLIDQNTQQPVMDLQGQPVMLDIHGPNGEPIQIGTRMVNQKVPRNCPKIIPIDIYDLLIDPDEKIVAHVSETSWGELRRQYEVRPELYFPEAMAELARRLNQYKELDRDGIIIRQAEVWDSTTKTVSQITFGEDADAIGWKDRRYQYRNASYSAYKRKVYNGPPILLYTGPNPFAHQRCPILHLAYIKVKGDTYGIGVIEKISDLTEGVNVFVNMITDNWNLGINRRFAYDVQVDIDHDQLSNGNTPGGKVGVVGDPSKAIMPLPNFAPNPEDYQIIDLYRGMIEMSSGISDFYGKGIGSSGGNRTAGGISQVINESGYVFKLVIRNIELQVLQPLAQMTASMIQQFGTPELEYSLTNVPPTIPTYGRVKLANLIGNYDFDFVAANYATGKVVKQRNLMAFYNIALQSPYINQAPFLLEIARAMEIPNANRLMKPEQQVQQEQSTAQQIQEKQALLEKLLDFETKAVVEQIRKKEPNIVTAHGMSVQETVEAYLGQQAEDAGLFPDTNGPVPTHNGRHEGRANTSSQIDVPGGEISDHMRGFSQQNGANAL